MEYNEASMVVREMLDPYNGYDLDGYCREAIAKVLEWADRYEDLHNS